jgi:hypothetical protein
MANFYIQGQILSSFEIPLEVISNNNRVIILSAQKQLVLILVPTMQVQQYCVSFVFFLSTWSGKIII